MSVNFLSKIMNRINGRSASAPTSRPKFPPVTVYVTSHGRVYVKPAEVLRSEEAQNIMETIIRVVEEHRKKGVKKTGLVSHPGASGGDGSQS